MEHPFEMWSDRIASAHTDDARRALLGEAKVFRARHLSDVDSVRRATFAISRLHAVLGERDPAVHEAKQLLSLCQTTPVASSEELDAARGYLAGLGERVPLIVNPPKERSWRERPGRESLHAGSREREPRPPRQERPQRELRPVQDTRVPGGGLQAAREAAIAGRWNEVVDRIGRPTSPQAALLAACAELSRILEDGADRARLTWLRDQLASAAGVRAPSRGPAAAPGTDPLSKLLGVTVPDKRAPRLRLIEEFADRHPDQVDALAAASLRHHVQVVGARVPAPWLVGTVARALATGPAPETEAAIAELRSADAVAALAYDEWPFDRIVRLVTRALGRGQGIGGIRRGVLAGGNEPDERKVWTVRLRSDDGERMIAVAPHAADAYPSGKAEEVAARLHELCPSTLLLATGSGNEALRSAVSALGCTVLDRDADDDRVLASALEMPGAQPSERRHREPEPADLQAPASAPTAEAAAAARLPRIADLVSAEPFDEAALRDAVAGLKRPDRALRMVRGDLPDDRLSALLRAVAVTTPADRPLSEGATMALRGGGPLARAVLLETPQYAGPGVGVVADVAAALVHRGWDLHRVLRGPTHRERERHPALETLSDGLSGLWRLLVRHGDRRGEVWVVADLPAEGRAGVPLLLLEDWQRVVVLPDDADLVAWWSSLGSVAGVRWTGDVEPLLAAADAFEARESRAPEGAEGTDGSP